ncbi:decaprenyl-phosphate phosphoribosyltransferase [Candidatus Microgenomates bacterium]|nr:decaprenyl-phosphate phosphoribosyltransferase [Candidatus Microgenomates bacterium]
MLAFFYHLFRILRPRQWIKNLALFAAIIFNGQLFNESLLVVTLYAFIVFCLLSSATYIINDVFDKDSDRLHPSKKFRPIAKGDIPVWFGLFLAAVFIIIGLYTASIITPSFLTAVLAYLFLQFSYSLIFKKLAVLDILTIAAGYMIRVYSGEFATGFHISVWLLITAVSLSLFLAIGKRRSELTLLSGYSPEVLARTRKSLSHYSEKLLDVYTIMFATSTFITYSLFTFLESPPSITVDILLPQFFPGFFERKWLMATIPLVVFGIMRYLQDIYEKQEGESPERVLFNDKPLLLAVFLWGLLVITVIYLLA